MYKPTKSECLSVICHENVTVSHQPAKAVPSRSQYPAHTTLQKTTSSDDRS